MEHTGFLFQPLPCRLTPDNHYLAEQATVLFTFLTPSCHCYQSIYLSPRCLLLSPHQLIIPSLSMGNIYIHHLHGLCFFSHLYNYSLLSNLWSRVLLVVLGGVVPLGTSNPVPVPEQKCQNHYPVPENML